MRTVLQSDVAAIAELDAELFPDNCMNESTVLRELQLGSGNVVYDGNELVAYSLIRWDWELIDITRIGVKSTHRGRGLATRMLGNILGSAHLDVMLCVNKDNHAAIRLYMSHGFEIVAQFLASWVMVMRRVTF